MKKLMLSFILCSAALFAFAQEPAATPPAQDQKASEMQVSATDLPPAITAALQGQDYSGWTVSNATKKEKDGKTYYKVDLKNGAETKTVKFDADGNMMKGKDKDKDKSVQ
jgi:uncharacterized membrane protein YkoI